ASYARRCAVEQVDREAPLEHHDQGVNRPYERRPEWRYEQILNGAEEPAGTETEESGVDVHVNPVIAGRRASRGKSGGFAVPPGPARQFLRAERAFAQRAAQTVADERIRFSLR